MSAADTQIDPVDNKEDNPSDAVACDSSMAKMRSRVERHMRSTLPHERMSAGTSVYMVAALESVMASVVSVAEAQRLAARKPKRSFGRLDLIAGVRKNKDLARAFRPYCFTPATNVRLDSDVLRTKHDKSVAQSKRQAAQLESKAKRAAPNVLEE